MRRRIVDMGLRYNEELLGYSSSSSSSSETEEEVT